jgi:hypothetical protein
MNMCHLCDMRKETNARMVQRRVEHVALGSVLIAEEPDRTVARIYKPLSVDHRARLLALLSEIDATPSKGAT